MFWSRKFSISASIVAVFAVQLASFSPGDAHGQVELEEQFEKMLADVEQVAGSIEIHLGGVEEIFGKLVDEQAKSIEHWGEKCGEEWEDWAERFESRMERWGAQQEKAWNQWAKKFENKMEQVAGQLDNEKPDTELMMKLVRAAIEEAEELPIGETVEGVVEHCLEQLEEAPWESFEVLGKHLNKMAHEFGEGLEKKIDAIDVDDLADKVERIVEGQLEFLHELDREHEHGHQQHHQRPDRRHRIEIEIDRDDANGIQREVLRQLNATGKAKNANNAESGELIRIDRNNPEEVELANEIQRLRAEKERLLGKNTRLKKLREKAESLRAEVERLRAENGELDSKLNGDDR